MLKLKLGFIMYKMLSYFTPRFAILLRIHLLVVFLVHVSKIITLTLKILNISITTFVSDGFVIRGSLPVSFIHSFIPPISIAPLQVLYYSEALLTTARVLYRSFQ